MSSIYTIYSAFNVVTKQRYIGFDSNWPNRQKCHKREYQKNNNIKFYNSIRKHGWNNFVWEIIYQAKEDVSSKDSHTLNIMEPYFIKEYDTLENGYNMTTGGDRGPILFGEKNPMFGKDRKELMKKVVKASVLNSKGRTYEQIYGIEKSQELKKRRSIDSRGKDNSYKNNPRFDIKEYTFHNIKTGEKTTSNRWDFYTKYNINKGGVSEIINHGITYKGWKIL